VCEPREAGADHGDVLALLAAINTLSVDPKKDRGIGGWEAGMRPESRLEPREG
jgi:hypothetical protein